MDERIVRTIEGPVVRLECTIMTSTVSTGWLENILINPGDGGGFRIDDLNTDCILIDNLSVKWIDRRVFRGRATVDQGSHGH